MIDILIVNGALVLIRDKIANCTFIKGLIRKVLLQLVDNRVGLGGLFQRPICMPLEFLSLIRGQMTDLLTHHFEHFSENIRRNLNIGHEISRYSRRSQLYFRRFPLSAKVVNISKLTYSECHPA
ncbi:hypothetical protein [Rhizobium sp. ZPR3]|uniref:Uncharacterized protein n=2 Tax=unclassified Rhizobium TaxID=2613769 RepID=A0AAU7SRP1_9HYPH